MVRIPCFLLAIAVTWSLLLTACAPPEPVRIGFIGGTSGWSPDFGIDGLHGARLAIEMRNKAGGINGRQVELIAADDQQNPDVARKEIARLIEHKVETIVGPMTSSIAGATVPLINQAKLLMISPSATTNELSGQDDFFFRVAPATRDYVKTSADFYFQKKGLRRLRVIYDLSNRAYTENWTRDFSDVFKAAGGETLPPVDFTSSNNFDFSALASRALADEPDGIIIVANAVDTAMLCASLRKLDTKVAIGTSEWSSTGRLIELGGKSVEGVTVEHFFDMHGTQAPYVAFRDAFIERYGQPPGFSGLYAFDATNIILDALAKKRADQSLKQVLLSIKDFAGLQHPISFDANGDTQGKTYVFVIKDGKFQSARSEP